MTQYVIIVPNSLLSKEIAPMNMHANIPHIYVETRSLTASITETMLKMFANSPIQTCHVAIPYTPLLSLIDDITIKKIIDITYKKRKTKRFSFLNFMFFNIILISLG